MGRTPMLGKKIRDFLPEEDLLAYSEAILRVYNMHGRRDNKYKARIKILVHETGDGDIAQEIEAEFEANRHGVLRLPEEEVRRIAAYFAPAGLRRAPRRERDPGACAPCRPGLRPLGPAQRQPPPCSGLRHRRRSR